jgi:TRAP-type C4-dicarboxylate transport system permease small subunit
MRKVLSNFWEVILAACVVVLCVGVFMQVLLRYAIKVSFPAIEEIVSMSFIYTIFLGAAVGMKRMEHLNIDFLLKRLPPGLQKVLRLVVAAGTALFLFFVVREGIGFVRDSYTQTTTYLNLPMSYSYAAIPGSGLIMLYYLAKRTYATIRSGGTSAAEAEGGHS